MEGYSLKKFLQSPINPFQLPYVLLVLAGIGFLDALYLAIEHYHNVIPPCTLHGCDLVLTSSFSTLWGLPISVYGIAFYIAVMILSVVLITVIPTRSFQEASALGTKSGIQDEGSRVKPGMTKRNLFQFLIPLLFLLCSLGFFVGIILIYIQAFVLHAFCQYCLLSELIDFLLFDASWWLYNSQKGTV